MADPSQTKSEAASPRKREKSREQGQFASSNDFATGLILLLMVQLLRFLSDHIGRELIELISVDLTSAVYYREMSIQHATAVAWSSVHFFIRATISLIAGSVVLAILANILQIGFQLTPQLMEWKPSRISPANGMKRIFSLRALVRSGMAMGKFLACLSAIAAGCYAKRASFFGVPESLAHEASQIWNMCLFVATLGAMGLLLVGAIDFAYQRFQHEVDLRMTRQELKDETKESEGDGQVRARMRKLQREAVKQRSLKDVPEATVVVTNPTHFAVALRYDPDRMATPMVVAKGKDHLAQRIKRIAAEANVPTLERKAVARALYASTEVGQEVPAELYRAVAEIIAYVYRLK